MAVGGKQMNNRAAGGRQQYNLRVIATGGGPLAPPLSPLSPHSPAPLRVGLDAGEPESPRTPRTPSGAPASPQLAAAGSGGSGTRRSWRLGGGLWWLLVAPIALLITLFAGELFGGWGITNGGVLSPRVLISRAAVGTWGQSVFPATPGPNPETAGLDAAWAPSASDGDTNSRGDTAGPRSAADAMATDESQTAPGGAVTETEPQSAADSGDTASKQAAEDAVAVGAASTEGDSAAITEPQQQPEQQPEPPAAQPEPEGKRRRKGKGKGKGSQSLAEAFEAAAAASVGAAALAPGVEPRVFAPEREWTGRVTQARVVVMPSQNCQLLRPGLEDACMATNGTGKACLGIFKGGKYMHSYISPFIRLDGYIQKFGIVNYTINTAGHHLWRTPGDGSDWDKLIAASDIIILEEHEVPYIMPHYSNKAYVVLQANAAAAMATCGPEKQCSRKHLRRPQVKRYLQHTSLVPLELNNAQRLRHLPHYQLMQQVHMSGIAAEEVERDWQPGPGTPAFTQEMLAKVRTLIPMFWRWRYPMTCRGQSEYVEFMAPSLQQTPQGRPPDFLPAIADRPIDVVFSGSASTPYWRDTPSERVQNQLYAKHRGALLSELDAIKARNPDLRIEVAAHISYADFVQLLRSTKIFISPLGHGEYSGKDYEATFSRLVMVKPLARHLTSYPDIYEVNTTCAEVAMDFSNLETVVKGLLADPKRMQTIADGAYHRLVECSDPRKLAADVAEMLHEVAEETGLNSSGGGDQESS